MNSPASKIEFASVTVSFFIHSTEDGARLVSTVSKALQISEKDMDLEQLKGHYGNEMLFARTHITGIQASNLGRRVLATLDEASRRTLLSEIEKSVDEHDALYIRLDRQLIPRSFSLGSDEPIRIKLKPRNRYGGRITTKEAYMELLSV